MAAVEESCGVFRSEVIGAKLPYSDLRPIWSD